jgi:alkylated DNA repair dioxygenase AlkB
MDTLFPIEIPFPPGFTYQEDFLNMEEESTLVSIIETIPVEPYLYQGFEAKRKVARFGKEYDAGRDLGPGGKTIPAAFEFLLEKIARYLGMDKELFTMLLVTEYPPGSVINWHRDSPPFQVIIGISLLSDCTFRMRPQDAAKQSRKSIISFPVRRRSIYVMRGAARSDWQHSIAPVKEKRYSITIRR